jgi:filamentous hemagglutinin
VHPATNVIASVSVDAGLSIIGGAIKDTAKSIVQQSNGFSDKVQSADEFIAGTESRPTPKQSEVDVGKDLGGDARPQVSYKDGKEVAYGTPGSVRPDWCVGTTCSVEVKNYNLANNEQGLISSVSTQAKQRAENLPGGMVQTVVIDVRGQAVDADQVRRITQAIVDKSGGAIKPGDIQFKR